MINIGFKFFRGKESNSTETLGVKGKSWLEPGYIYAPYVLSQSTPGPNVEELIQTLRREMTESLESYVGEVSNEENREGIKQSIVDSYHRIQGNLRESGVPEIDVNVEDNRGTINVNVTMPKPTFSHRYSDKTIDPNFYGKLKI